MDRLAEGARNKDYMDLATQYQTINRMLAQRMMRHAEAILRQWATELNRFEYFDRLSSLSQNYDYTFQYYLSTPIHYEGDPDGKIDDDRDAILSDMTRQYYLLADDMFAAMLLSRGQAPTMLGFGRDNRNSIMNYFSQCVRLRDEDIEWLEATAADRSTSALAILTISALSVNLRNLFQQNAFMALLRLAYSDNTVVAEQTLGHLILLMAYYDVRLDFFPDIQDTFRQLMGDGERAYITMLSLIRSAKPHNEDISPEMLDALPDEVYEVLDANRDNIEEKMNAEMAHVSSFLTDIVAILPGTWVFSTIAHDDTQREKVAQLYVDMGMNAEAFDGVLLGRSDVIQSPELRADYLLYNELYDEALAAYEGLVESGNSTPRIRFRIGWCALMTQDYDKAERYMVGRLREKKPWVEDYLNYAHLCFLKGDKVTAYEYYKEALHRAGSMKRFKSTFCPDRKVLVDMGIPIQEVYLMEDRLMGQ